MRIFLHAQRSGEVKGGGAPLIMPVFSWMLCAYYAIHVSHGLHWDSSLLCIIVFIFVL